MEFELVEGFKKLDEKDKVIYLEEKLNKKNLRAIIRSLINSNQDVFLLINDLSKKKNYKNKYKYNSLKLNSIIIEEYFKLNKDKELLTQIRKLKEKDLDNQIKYEINNKTSFSKTSICKELNDKNYRRNFLKAEIKNNKTKVSIGFIITIIIFVFLYLVVGSMYYVINYYNNHIYPNTYINNELVSNKSNKDVIKELNSYKKTLTNTITFIGQDENFVYSFNDIGITTNVDIVKGKILENKGLNGYIKLYKLLLNSKNEYFVEYNIDDEVYNKFVEELKSKCNKVKKNEVFKISGGKLYYEKGIDGFTLDDSKLKEQVMDSLKNNVTEISLTGSTDIASKNLSNINTKIASYTTSYSEAQSRAQNIRNAANRMNGTILQPGAVYSYYRNVGPYNASGYVFYGKYMGSGVCQVSTTLYNSVLRSNLQIVERHNHGEMVPYVDYGMDATVYGSTTDFRFKNNTKYPIYIEAYAYSGNVTVNFWSNNALVDSGYTYKPRSVNTGGLTFSTYLDTYLNGTYQGTKYLNSSSYYKGK